MSDFQIDRDFIREKQTVNKTDLQVELSKREILEKKLNKSPKRFSLLKLLKKEDSK